MTPPIPAVTRPILVRGGTLVDGAGSPAREADVEIIDGRIARVEPSIQPASHEVIDARGCLVTPGFVDVHTHYDGHVTWADSLSPSSLHGVTTAVMGNCGVGFAPCAPEHRELLIGLMEAIEDIPGPVLQKGLPWNWRTFPEYLDALDARRYDIDIAAQLPHAALRVNVMGERAVRREAATAQDRAEMARQAGEAIRAGAVGFTTSRTMTHHTKFGEMTPDFMAAEIELVEIAQAIAREGRGVMQVITDIAHQKEAGVADFELLRRLVKGSGLPLSISCNQKESDPGGANRLLAMIKQASADGLPIKAQVMGRPIGLILGFGLTLNPFMEHPSYAAIAELPLAERVRRMGDPALRAKILSQQDQDPSALPRHARWDRLFPIEQQPDYEPRYKDSVQARAQGSGKSPAEWAYDYLLQDGGTRMLYRPMVNYHAGNLDQAYEMLTHPDAVRGLGDGGAHSGMTCDAGVTSFNLSYWGRHRTLGPKLPIEMLVQGHTSRSAALVGLHDRGRIAPGLKGDVNVIDLERLRPHPVEVAHDMPAGGRRVVQRATGYVATLVSGVPILRDDELTGARPGRLVRSGRLPA